MPFITDKQTIEDLSIFDRHKDKSVYGMFNHTFTRGGADLLHQMFNYPLADADAINKRVGIIQYFAENETLFAFNAELFDIAEHYLENTDERAQLPIDGDSVINKINSAITGDALYKFVYSGIVSIVDIVNSLRDLIAVLSPAKETPYITELEQIEYLLEAPVLNALPKNKIKGKLSYKEIASLDVALRFKNKQLIKTLFIHLYRLDVYISVAKIAAKKSFAFPFAQQTNKKCLLVEGLYYPFLNGAVPNNLDATHCNIIFLTGANMAGKSTFMRSLGTAMYLAHMGFPVPASKMEFSVMDGIYTTINLPDDLGIGISHFYAEVLRVKKIAKELAQKKNLFVIIDELFRGTNVKDAYEATVAVTRGFANKHLSTFIISTHIIEAGEALKQDCNSIAYKYMPTRMDGNKPVYTYKLENGITEDRHGMLIINNEGIMDILKKRKVPVV